MKALGIVVEYNPLHNGHKYHFEEAKRITGADIVIAVMSSSFVQRGEPAIINKEERVKLALELGVDLVIELPFLYTVENADYFAYGAIHLLNELKVDCICFGSETGNTEEFLRKYDISSIAQPHLDFLVHDYMDQGMSYPAAFSKALKDIDSFMLDEPNDILGYAYMNVIKSNNMNIEVHTIKRDGDYSSDILSNTLPSAKAIRHSLVNNEDVSSYVPFNISNMKYTYLEDYFDILKYKLVTSSHEQIASIHLVTEGIEYLLKDKIIESNSMEEFIKKCTSKRYTAARIKRIIIHILVGTNKKEAKEILASKPPYARILGINKKGQEYLSIKRKSIKIPVLNRFKGKEYALLQLEKKASYVYYCKYDKEQLNTMWEHEHCIYPIRKED